MNAFDAEQIDALHAAIRWLIDAPEVRVAVLAGNGRAFCAGGDITTFDEIDAETGFAYTRRGYDNMLRPLGTGRGTGARR